MAQPGADIIMKELSTGDGVRADSAALMDEFFDGIMVTSPEVRLKNIEAIGIDEREIYGLIHPTELYAVKIERGGRI